MAHKEVLEDVIAACCPKPEGYCILKEMMMHNGSGDRTLVQLKCIEVFKYEQSRAEGRDVGWEGVHKAWVDGGFAKAFSEVYQEGMRSVDAYIQTMNRVKNDRTT